MRGETHAIWPLHNEVAVAMREATHGHGLRWIAESVEASGISARFEQGRARAPEKATPPGEMPGGRNSTSLRRRV